MSTNPSENAAYAVVLLFLLLHVLFQPNQCHAKKLGNSCGNIHKIRFPFQLRDGSNPICKESNFTLSCENNRAIFQLGSRNYYVNDINYKKKTMRIVDTSIDTNICSSLPLLPLQPYNISSNNLFRIDHKATMVLFLKCEKPVNSPLFTDISTYCHGEVSDFSELGNYSYVMAGVRKATTRDIGDSCTAETMVWTSSPLTRNRVDKNFSLEDVHSELTYGFELYWVLGCDKCRQLATCSNNSSTCPQYCDLISFLTNTNTAGILRGVILMIIYFLPYPITLGIGPIIAARVLSVPCVFAFLAYKFRRRHLSTFDNIEGFLRSQNNLMPVRYSYRDIRKMTNNFKVKLGEGGYGSVYKGKLRSGHFVATSCSAHALHVGI